MHTRRAALLFSAAIGMLSVTMPAVAQTQYPDRPIKIIVGLPAGGSADMIARMLGQKLNA